MKEFSVLGELNFNGSEMRLFIQVIDQETKEVKKTYNRKFKNEKNSVKQMCDVANVYQKQGYELFTIKGFGLA